jgi:cytochrome c
MKKIFLIAFVITGIIACNSGNDKKSVSATTDITKDPAYQRGLELVSNNKCFQCHQIEGKLTGPSYREVAAKYAGASDEQITTLADRIIKGSNGVWGEIFMTPHPNVSVEDAKAMVKYILLMNK